MKHTKRVVTLLLLSSATFAYNNLPISGHQPILEVYAQTTGDLTQFRKTLIEITPITQAQLDQFDDATIQEIIDMLYRTTPGGDPSSVFNVLMRDYPEVFQSEVKRIRDALVKDHGLLESSLDKVEDSTILWEELAVFNDNQEKEDFQTLADILVSEYDVEKVPHPSQYYPGAEIRKNLLTETPIISSQLNQFTDKELEDALAAHLKENVTGGDIGTLFDYLLTNYPQVFKAEIDRIKQILVNDHQLNSQSLDQVTDSELLWTELTVFNMNNQKEDFKKLAEDLVSVYNVEKEPQENQDPKGAEIRDTLIKHTPVLSQQLDFFTDQDLEVELTMYYEENENGGDPGTLFDYLLTKYPELFQTEINRIKEVLVKDYQLDGPALDKFSTRELLWEEFHVYQANGDQEDFAQLAEKLNALGIPKVPSSPVITDFKRFREELINSTPIIQAQLDQFTDQEIEDLIEEVTENSQGGDPAGVYNLMVAKYPGVFQAEYDQIVKNLVEQYGIEQTGLKELGMSQLLWEEYLIWAQQSQTNYQALADKLVKDHPTLKQTVVVEKEKTSVSADKNQKGQLPETGESNGWGIVVAGILVLLAGGGLLLTKKRSIDQ